MRSEEAFVAARDGERIFVRVWTPDTGAPRAVVQISHGLAEHGGRYARFGEALTSAGFAVIASDHRGHGPHCSARDLGFFASAGGWRLCLDDLANVKNFASKRFPSLPIVFFGHSMGSVMGQSFIAEHGAELAGAVLSGTSGTPPAVLPLGRLIARFERLRLGPRGKSALLQKMLFGEFNRAFKPARTPFDWLSRDPVEVDKYIADPLSGFAFSNQLAVDLLDAVGPTASPATVAQIRKDLPIYVFSGSHDPVSATVQGLLNNYRAAGLTRVTLRIYPEARHETLNETNRDAVTADLIAWLRDALA